MELLTVNSYTNSSSSPGKDNIHCSMISKLSVESKTQLLHISNSIWKNEEPVPTDWNDYIIIPLLKRGKSGKSIDSYRPISLASCIVKLFERLIMRRLEYWIEKNKLLPKSRFGFSKERSMTDAVASLVIGIYLAFIRGNKYITSIDRYSRSI